MRDRLTFEEKPSFPAGTVCPRCDAQIVLWKGEFNCTVCGLDTHTWLATMETERLVPVKEYQR